jgi:ADP-ribose pyrophosphatase YjhB (NUDIX family)
MPKLLEFLGLKRPVYGKFFPLTQIATLEKYCELGSQYRVTVMAIVWRQRGKDREVLVIKKLSARLRGIKDLMPQELVLFEASNDLPKGGWRDDVLHKNETLIMALERELKEEAQITPKVIKKIELKGVAYHKLTRHNQHRHSGSLGKLLVVFEVKVTSAYEWRQGSDPRIYSGSFESKPTQLFSENSTKRKILESLGFAPDAG